MSNFFRKSLFLTTSALILGSLAGLNHCNASSFGLGLNDEAPSARTAVRTADIKAYQKTEEKLIVEHQKLLKAQSKGENIQDLTASVVELAHALQTQIDNGAQADLMENALAKSTTDSTFTESLKNAGHKIKAVFKSKTNKIKMDDDREDLNVLSLDGGGMRGIGTLCMLSVLEMKTGKKTYELFDRIYGTSTGGLAAVLLASGKSATEVLDIYFDNIDRIFARSWQDVFSNPGGLFGATYNPKGIEGVIKDYVGDAKLKDVKVPVAVSTVDSATGDAMLLSSENEETRDVSMLEAGRATSAAPTYFPAMPVQLKDKKFMAVDGGVAANNPAELAYKDIKENLDGHYNIKIFSLGTGVEDLFKLDSNAGKLGFGNPANMPAYFMGINEKNIDKRMQDLQARGKIEYNRFNFELPFAVDLADTSQHAKNLMLQLAWERAHEADFTSYVKGVQDTAKLSKEQPKVVIAAAAA